MKKNSIKPFFSEKIEPRPSTIGKNQNFFLLSNLFPKYQPAPPEYGKRFDVHTDGYNHQLGVVISQNGTLVAYFRASLTKRDTDTLL